MNGTVQWFLGSFAVNAHWPTRWWDIPDIMAHAYTYGCEDYREASVGLTLFGFGFRVSWTRWRGESLPWSADLTRTSPPECAVPNTENPNEGDER